MSTSAALLLPTAARRHVPTELFGTLDVGEDQIVEFPDGVFGFPLSRQWVLIAGEKQGTAWLQSLDILSLTFLLVDPFEFFPGFSVELAPGDLRRLGAAEASQVAVFAVVTLPSRFDGDATANLRGPILMNAQARRGAQVVIDEGPWHVREPLRLAGND